MRLIFKILLVFVAIFSFQQAKSTHVMGSDISWECIGKDTFRVRITLYRDCNGCDIPPCETPSLTVVSNCGSKSYNTSKSGGNDITPVCDEYIK